MLLPFEFVRWQAILWCWSRYDDDLNY